MHDVREMQRWLSCDAWYRTFSVTRAETNMIIFCSRHVVNTHVMSLLILNKLHDQRLLGMT